MDDREREKMLADCLEDYHRQKALGHIVGPDQFQDHLGDHYPEFVEIIEAEQALDESVDPLPKARKFPRAFGEYTLLSELGGGAMGVVYEALHRGLGRKVALKILRTGFDTEPIALERFRREARACAQVRHDHIVEIYEAGEVDGRPFYAMPLIEGKSLMQLIRAGEAPEPRELARGLAGIADALLTLHRAGIIHRDVKPANIMVSPDGDMTLADFGLAKTAMTQSMTQTGQAMGTPLYMSPEQALGNKDEIDGRSDVYAIGATLYEVLADRPPFQAKNYHDLMRLIVSERPKSLVSVAPEAPKDLCRVAMKAIESRRRDRYQTAAELRDDLLSFAEGGTPTGKPVSRLRHGFRRYRLRAAIAAAVVLVAAVWINRSANLPGTIRISCRPEAEVLIDGNAKGQTPREVELPPGRHRVELRLEGFQPVASEVELEADQKHTMAEVLIVADPEDAVAMAKWADAMGMKLGTYDAPRVERGGGSEAAFVLAYPRGAVRMSDLSMFRAEVRSELYEDDGKLEFRRGEEVLWSKAFAPEGWNEIAGIPSEVRDALKVGDVLTWGIWPAEGAPVTAECSVVADEVEGLAELERGMAGQKEAVKRHLRAQLYLERGLNTAALLEARKFLGEKVRSARALATIEEALTRMGAMDSSLRTEVLAQIQTLDESERRGVFPE